MSQFDGRGQCGCYMNDVFVVFVALIMAQEPGMCFKVMAQVCVSRPWPRHVFQGH